MSNRTGSYSSDCALCGERFVVLIRGRGARRRYCSTECRDGAVRNRYERTDSHYMSKCPVCWEWIVVPVTRGQRRRYCSEECRLEANRIDGSARNRRKRAELLSTQTPIKYVECLHCGTTMVCPVIGPGCRKRFCSRWCHNKRASVNVAPAKKAEIQRRYRANNPEKFDWSDAKKAAHHRRRARKKTGAPGERIVPGEVFERDGWRCGICNRAVKPDLAYPHPRSASLDHIVPLSKGGTHTLANVQLAHLDCNLGKRDRVDNVQLRLIG